MYVPPHDVVRDAASLKQFTVTIREHEPITIYACDEAEALDAVTRHTNQFDDSHGTKPNLHDVAIERLDGEPVVDLAAIEPLQQQIGDLGRQLRAEEERHAAAMQSINDRLAATRAALSTVKHANDNSNCDRRLEAARPGITSELAALRAKLKSIQHGLVIELLSGTSNDEWEARERTAVEQAKAKIAEIGQRLAAEGITRHAHTHLFLQRKGILRELRNELQPRLDRAVAHNRTRKPLTWHREEEAALVAQYNELVAHAVNAITDEPTGPPEVVVVPQQEQQVPQYQSIYRGMRPAVSDVVRC